MKGIIYIILNIKYIFQSGKLFRDRKYQVIVIEGKKRLERKIDDFLAIRNIALANVYMQNGEEGFSYLQRILPNVRSAKFFRKIISFFVTPEWKIQNYNAVIYRCEHLLEVKVKCIEKEDVFKFLIAGYMKVLNFRKVVELYDRINQECPGNLKLREFGEPYKKEAEKRIAIS